MQKSILIETIDPQNHEILLISQANCNQINRNINKQKQQKIISHENSQAELLLDP